MVVHTSEPISRMGTRASPRERSEAPKFTQQVSGWAGPQVQAGPPLGHSLPCSSSPATVYSWDFLSVPSLLPGPLHLLPLLLAGSSPDLYRTHSLLAHTSLSQRAASFPSVTFSPHTIISLLYSISYAYCVFLCFLSSINVSTWKAGLSPPYSQLNPW